MTVERPRGYGPFARGRRCIEMSEMPGARRAGREGGRAHLCEGKDSSCERHGVGCVEREREREVGGCCCYERL